jgi:hypothetical protein
MGAMFAEHRGACMRRVPTVLAKDYTVGVIMPVQTRLRTTAEYTYTDNRFTGFTGHLALLELQANW